MTIELSYTIRESPRARQVSLRYSPTDGLTVIIPRGFDRRRIPAIVQSKQAWLDRARRHFADRPAPAPLPEQIVLPAVGEPWRIVYRPTPAARPALREAPDNTLTLCGPVADMPACKLALHRWLARLAGEHFTPWLNRLAEGRGFHYSRLTIRFQRTRWGSASVRRSINLNLALLFLSPALVRYVMLHELCHTVELNHSPRFWALLAGHFPAYKDARRELRAAWSHLPAWLTQR